MLGALAARDWRPMHHDHDFAVNRNGTRDIFMNTPNQAAWFERYLTDWTGPSGRLGRMKFRMKGSVFPGDTMVLEGVVRAVEVDDAECGWVTVDVSLRSATTWPRRAQRASRCRPGRRQPVGPAPRRTPWEALMDLDFTPEQEMLRDAVRGVCARHAGLDVVREMEDDPVGYPEKFWLQLGELGLLGADMSMVDLRDRVPGARSGPRARPRTSPARS